MRNPFRRTPTMQSWGDIGAPDSYTDYYATRSDKTRLSMPTKQFANFVTRMANQNAGPLPDGKRYVPLPVGANAQYAGFVTVTANSPLTARTGGAASPAPTQAQVQTWINAGYVIPPGSGLEGSNGAPNMLGAT